MPQIDTKHFGAVACREEALFEFPAGLPGFEAERLFVPLEYPTSNPIVFLQSLRCPSLCFITLPVQAADAGYQLAIAAEDLRLLGLPPERQPVIGAEVVCLAVVSVAAGAEPTANLLAPIVVNLANRRAVQAIQEGSNYSHRRPLAAQRTEGACS
jgi:flagellar assembly factor FliW